MALLDIQQAPSLHSFDKVGQRL